jgi:tetratricopeptide (TPR) repeat protein
MPSQAQFLNRTIAISALVALSAAAVAQPETAPPALEPTVAAPGERVGTQTNFGDQAKLGEFETAATTGLRLIELVEAEEGPNSTALAEVLFEVGDVQRQAKQHDAAEVTLMRSIEIYQAQGGRTAPELIKPMTSLGMNYNDAENYGPAIGVLGEARTLSRRNFGLLNEGQIEIVDHLTVGFVGLRQYEQADHQQLMMLQLYQRNHGTDTVAALPGVYKHAAYLRRRGLYGEALTLYQRSVRVIQDELGKTDPALAAPLRGIGNSFREQLLFDGLGASALKRSIEILEQADPVDYANLAQSYRDLGDWLTVFSRIGNGAKEYELAWQLLDQAEDGEELQERWFGSRTAKWVHQQPFSQRGLRLKGQEPGLKDGFVLIQLDVKSNGRTDNIVVIESEPAGAKDETIARSARKSRLRPHIVDGKVARLEGLRLRYEFTYKPDAF